MTNVIYARVSTPDQDLEHQKENLWDYATNTLDLEPSSIDVITDTKTGSTTERPGFIDLLERVGDGEVDRIIIREITRLGRSFRDIHETVHQIVDDHGVGFYVTDDNIEIDPGGELSMRDKMFVTLLGWGAELEAEKLRENTRNALQAARAEGKWVGRPPFGFTTEDGYLVANEDYKKAMSVLYAKEVLGWSDRKAGRYSNVSRRTVPSIMDRKELYMPDESFTRDGEPVPVEVPEDPDIGHEEMKDRQRSELQELRQRIEGLEDQLEEDEF